MTITNYQSLVFAFNDILVVGHYSYATLCNATDCTHTVRACTPTAVFCDDFLNVIAT